MKKNLTEKKEKVNFVPDNSEKKDIPVEEKVFSDVEDIVISDKIETSKVEVVEDKKEFKVEKAITQEKEARLRYNLELNPAQLKNMTARQIKDWYEKNS